MREVSPGDIIFSFKDTHIVAIGLAESYCRESPKPQEFGTTGEYWNGLQSVYLAEISGNFAEVLIGLIGPEARNMVTAVAARAAVNHPLQIGDDLDYWEHRLELSVEKDQRIPETDGEAIIRARRGQGLFKERVVAIEKRCRGTRVDNLVHLVASHCKPGGIRTMKNDWMARTGFC
jgi:putative restriction endonuclease